MPGKVLILNTVGLLLQYVLLLLVYYFLYRVSRMIVQDLKEQAPPVATSCNLTGEVPDKQAVLTVLAGTPTDLAGKVFQLKETTALGRGEHNDIRIDDGFISHEHSCITRYNNEYWLADLQSTNCTYLNGQQISEEIMLKNGDVIKIGTITFKFER